MKYFKPVINVLIFLISGFLCILMGYEENEKYPACSIIVTFPDPGLEQRIRWEIDKRDGDICLSEVELITELSESACGDIHNLSGIEYLINLEKLRLQSSLISDLRPLSGLTKLTSLDLSDTNVYMSGIIEDINPLFNLSNLIHLNLCDHRVNDISSLSNLTNVTYLDLSRNKITNIDALSNLINLTYLDLSSNNIRNIYPLVANNGIDSGDVVNLYNNNLIAISLTSHIPALKDRGVQVLYNN